MHTIETARLKIRPFILDDLAAYHHRIYSDPEVTRYLPGGRPRALSETEDVIAYFVDHELVHGYSISVVLDKSSDQLIGHCGLHRFSNGEVEIGYSFARDCWGQGYATEAGRAMLRYGFEVVGLDEIIALAMPPNLASQRVMQKLGMYGGDITREYYGAELVVYRLSRADFVPDVGLYLVKQTHHEHPND